VSHRTFALPDLGEGLTEAEIVRWLVAEGDEIQIDQPVVEVETAKSVVEIPSPFAGRVVSLHGREGQTVDVGAPLISVETDTEEMAQYREEERAGTGHVLVGYGPEPTSTAGRRRRPRRRTTTPGPTPSGPRTVAAASSGPAAPATGTSDAPAAAPLVVSPLVRRLAREHGVDVRRVRGTGAGGLVTREDVEQAIAATARPVASAAEAGSPAAPSTGTAAPPSTQETERRIPLTAGGRAAAANLARSRAEIPEATVWVDVDATALVELRESTRTPDDPGPGLMAYLAGFVVAALREFPVFNGRFDAERNEIVSSTRINLGIAVQGERGLVVPTIMDAGAMSIAELDRAIDEVTARARAGRVSAAELAAGTFTLNNYGHLRVDGSAAIINYPQVAILGVGRIVDRPWVVHGQIQPRKITQLSFVFDHRVADGGTAAGFLRAVADAIENPVRALARR
jgi:pyruvate dehydrogenase E2 component (dihydrolipoamide acetyltransferase)